MDLEDKLKNGFDSNPSDMEGTTYVSSTCFSQLREMEECSQGESCLVMIHGERLGRCFIIDREPFVIGRSSACEIRLIDDSISRRQCSIIPTSEGIFVEDMGSKNGTFVNGQRIRKHKLETKDQILLGRTIFKFLTGDDIESSFHTEMFRLATIDNLTGAYNKQQFEKEISKQFSRFYRSKHPFSMLIFDIDHFKQINDTYGHIAGDRVLEQLGTLISENIRGENSFFRYGGEEFIVMMPDQSLEDAVTAAERIRHLVEETSFEYEEHVLSITISIGIAEIQQSFASPEELLKLADERLYLAKEKGRNRTEPPCPVK